MYSDKQRNHSTYIRNMYLREEIRPFQIYVVCLKYASLSLVYLNEKVIFDSVSPANRFRLGLTRQGKKIARLNKQLKTSVLNVLLTN